MAFVRAATATPAAPVAESRDRLIARLAGEDADDRRRAARALAKQPDAAEPLADRLASETDIRVIDALFASLVDIGGQTVAGLVARFLRSPDAALRGCAVEALKSLGGDAIEQLDALLGDADADVRLLAIEVTRVWAADMALPRLRRLIETDPHVNVCAAAVDVATEVGTPELIPALQELRVRFAGEPFLVFAADIACSRINGNSVRGD